MPIVNSYIYNQTIIPPLQCCQVHAEKSWDISEHPPPHPPRHQRQEEPQLGGIQEDGRKEEDQHVPAFLRVLRPASLTSASLGNLGTQFLGFGQRRPQVLPDTSYEVLIGKFVSKTIQGVICVFCACKRGTSQAAVCVLLAFQEGEELVFLKSLVGFTLSYCNMLYVWVVLNWNEMFEMNTKYARVFFYSLRGEDNGQSKSCFHSKKPEKSMKWKMFWVTKRK